MYRHVCPSAFCTSKRKKNQKITFYPWDRRWRQGLPQGAVCKQLPRALCPRLGRHRRGGDVTALVAPLPSRSPVRKRFQEKRAGESQGAESQPCNTRRARRASRLSRQTRSRTLAAGACVRGESSQRRVLQETCSRAVSPCPGKPGLEFMVAGGSVKWHYSPRGESPARLPGQPIVAQNQPAVDSEKLRT